MKTLREKIEVMQAFDRGEKIECRRPPDGEWFGAAAPSWDWRSYDFQVAPKRQKEPREFYVILHGEKPVAIGRGREVCVVDNDVPIRECRTIRVREVVDEPGAAQKLRDTMLHDNAKWPRE